MCPIVHHAVACNFYSIGKYIFTQAEHMLHAMVRRSRTEGSTFLLTP